MRRLTITRKEARESARNRTKRAAGEDRKGPSGSREAQAELATAETKVAQEQTAAIASALQEDETHRQADLQRVAEKEAEAVPWDRPADS